VERQKVVFLEYKGVVLGDAFRIDLLVNDGLLVEIQGSRADATAARGAAAHVSAFDRQAAWPVDQFQRQGAERRYQEGCKWPLNAFLVTHKAQPVSQWG
jgi:hypothetical protein